MRFVYNYEAEKAIEANFLKSNIDLFPQNSFSCRKSNQIVHGLYCGELSIGLTKAFLDELLYKLRAKKGRSGSTITLSFFWLAYRR